MATGKAVTADSRVESDYEHIYGSLGTKCCTINSVHTRDIWNSFLTPNWNPFYGYKRRKASSSMTVISKMPKNTAG